MRKKEVLLSEADFIKLIKRIVKETKEAEMEEGWLGDKMKGMKRFATGYGDESEKSTAKENFKNDLKRIEKEVMMDIEDFVYEDEGGWEMAKQEEKYLEEEVKKYRKANPHVKEDSGIDFRYTRARIYTKRANKLRESHQEYEVARLDMLRKGLKDAFGKDYWDLALDLVHHTKNEDEMDLYLIYEALVKEKKTRKI
jgi:hypothetical protein